MRVVFTISAITLFLILGVAGCATINAEKNAPPIGRFVEIDAERLHILEAGLEHKGAAPSIILIHGASINLRDMNIALGEPLSDRYHVMMIDRPGRGYSTRPEDGYRLAKQAELIHAAAQLIGAEKPIVVGQSFGGAVALAYALDYQKEMSGLVVLAPVSHEWPGGVAWYNTVSNTPVLGALLRRLVIPLFGPLSGPGGTLKSFAPDTPPDDYYNRVGLPLLFRPRDFKSNAEDIVNLKREIIAMQDQYGELTLPVAILTGADDTTVSPDIHSKTLASQIDAASLKVLPDTGHALHHAEKEIIIDAIDELAAM